MEHFDVSQEIDTSYLEEKIERVLKEKKTKEKEFKTPIIPNKKMKSSDHASGVLCTHKK